jgi:hypothetical protein
MFSLPPTSSLGVAPPPVPPFLTPAALVVGSGSQKSAANVLKQFSPGAAQSQARINLVGNTFTPNNTYTSDIMPLWSQFLVSGYYGNAMGTSPTGVPPFIFEDYERSLSRPACSSSLPSSAKTPTGVQLQNSGTPPPAQGLLSNPLALAGVPPSGGQANYAEKWNQWIEGTEGAEWRGVAPAENRYLQPPPPTVPANVADQYSWLSRPYVGACVEVAKNPTRVYLPDGTRTSLVSASSFDNSGKRDVVVLEKKNPAQAPYIPQLQSAGLNYIENLEDRKMECAFGLTPAQVEASKPFLRSDFLLNGFGAQLNSLPQNSVVLPAGTPISMPPFLWSYANRLAPWGIMGRL